MMSAAGLSISRSPGARERSSALGPEGKLESPMPPSPLNERLVVQILQRPRTLALHLNQTPSAPKRLPRVAGTQGLAPTRGLGLERAAAGRAGSQEPCQPAGSRTLDIRVTIRHPSRHVADNTRLSFRPQAVRKAPPLARRQQSSVGERGDRRGTLPRACLASPVAACLGTMHPLKCGCRGCWRLLRREEPSSASCVSCKPGMRALGCGPALRWVGCFPGLRSVSCISCDPSMKSVGSTCSFCSSDPIVTYDPRGSRVSGGDDDDDDYSVRTIWPEELARKMTQSKVHRQQSAVILDCRHLVDYTKSQLQGAISLNWTERSARERGQHGQLTVFDLLSSREPQQPFQPTWTQQASSSEPRTRNPGRAVTPRSRHLILDTLDRQDEESLRSQGDGSDRNATGNEPRSLDQSEDAGGGSLDDPQAVAPLTPDMENAELSPILPFLYLGNERDAQDMAKMQQLHVGCVINVTTHLPLYHAQAGSLRYKRIPATDNSKQDLRQYFEETFEFIEEAHQLGEGVLIHCQAGVSRSATLVIAYLMKHTLMTMSDAYKYVKGKRPVISPNLNFMGQLLEFEMDLNKGLTPRMLTPKLNGLETEV